MSIINRSFRNNQTGEIVKIIDSYQNIAITESKEKMDANHLTDTRYYSEYIDPNAFFNDPNTYNIFAEKIKNVDLSKIPEDAESFEVEVTNNPLAGMVNNESAIIYSDPSDEIEELKRKYPGSTVDSNALSIQNEAFSKILGEESPQASAIDNSKLNNRNYSQPENFVQRIEVEDPIITMFKNVKRNIDFSIDLKVEGKIPRLDFIEMMEDSYEISIIEFLAEEFTNKILSDPSFIKDKIMLEIKSRLSKNLTKEASKKESIDEEKTPVTKQPRTPRAAKNKNTV